MELAGLNIVMEADFSAVFSGMAQANTMFQSFAQNIKNAFSGIPDFKNKFNFTSNGASQAAQDAREYARAAREQAAADLDAAKAKIALEREADRQSNKNKNLKDEYGQLVAANQAMVREYYNAAASLLKYGDASGITAAKLEELRVKAKAGQDQLQSIEAGAGRFQRNVGNYASGFNPLTNSITQITREFPAFTNSIQTGLMGISNNIGPLADAIRQLNHQQKQAKAEAEAAALAKFKQAEAAAIAAGMTKAEAKEAGKLAAALAVATPEQLKAAAAARLSAEGLAMATGATVLQSKAAGDLAAKQALANTTAASSPTIWKALTSSIFSWQTALSVAVTVLTVYGPKLFAMISGTKDATEAKKKLKEQQEALNTADKNAIQSAAEQIGKLRALQATMVNQELSIRQRTIAYNEAQKTYPAYLNNVSKDQALNGGLADIINNRLIPAIIAAARARAYQEKINILTARQIELEEKAGELTKDRLKSQNALNSAKANFDKAASSTAPSNMEFGLDQAGSDLSGTTSKLKELTKTLNDNASERVKIINDIDKLTHKLDNASTAAGDLNKVGSFDKPVKVAKDYTAKIEKEASDIEKAWYKIKNTEAVLPEVAVDNSALPFDVLSKHIDEENERVARSLSAQLEIVQDVNAKIRGEMKKNNELLVGSIRSTLGEAADLIGEGISNLGKDGAGTFIDFVKSFGAMLGDQIKALGQQLIVSATVMAAIQSAIKGIGGAGGPVVAIGVGLGAIVAGAAIKAALSKKSSSFRTPFASGGVVYGPTNALVGEYAGARGNPEVIAPLDKLRSILKRDGVGQGGTQVFIPEMRLNGQDIYIAFKRAEKGRNR